MSIWSKLNNFSPSENWGDKDKVNGSLLETLDIITNEIKRVTWERYKKVSPCIIHCAYEVTGHSEKSEHYKGNAADFHFNNIPPLEAYETILQILKEYQKYNHVGFGVYPDWYNQGFHLDVRGYKARWSQVNGLYTEINKGVVLLKK
jgi:uncharacterized protein YcbK (DUF882 family)